jgi:hypothetical protein
MAMPIGNYPPAPPQRTIEAERNAWEAYARELEWKLEEITKSFRRRYVPDLDGARLTLVEKDTDEEVRQPARREPEARKP